MSFLTRLSTGWEIGMTSLKVLKANKQLVIFPLISGFSILLIIGSFFTVVFANAGWDVHNIAVSNRLEMYGLTFVYYLINYFIVVFFNMALIHCTKLYFNGEEVTLAKGIKFSASRAGQIFSWAIFAATVGIILRIVQENLGWIGKLIIGFVGFVWGVSTFFVVPILAYENLGPVAAFERSATMMKEKWGESLGATFSFGLMQLLAFVVIISIAAIIGSQTYIIAGVIFAAIGIAITVAITSAMNSIFVSLVYNNINGNAYVPLKKDLLDNLFLPKK